MKSARLSPVINLNASFCNTAVIVIQRLIQSYVQVSHSVLLEFCCCITTAAFMYYNKRIIRLMQRCAIFSQLLYLRCSHQNVLQNPCTYLFPDTHKIMHYRNICWCNKSLRCENIWATVKGIWVAMVVLTASHNRTPYLTTIVNQTDGHYWTDWLDPPPSRPSQGLTTLCIQK